MGNGENKFRNGMGGAREEEVLIKGTGKAIEKVLRLALYWQQREDVVITVRTGTIGAVDDVVERGEGGMEIESLVRGVNCLEIGIRLR